MRDQQTGQHGGQLRSQARVCPLCLEMALEEGFEGPDV